ncbi:MAG: glycoside hydrolase, partial [Gammaproteobacteria bacterium]|nr:glycoside hydrolase [Gammaproteobacteria bacterium]
MNLGNTKASVAVTVFLLMLGACQSSGPVHKHHGNDVLPAECERADALPSVRCASAASARFGPDGRLWLVWAQAGHVYVSSSSDQGKTFKSTAMVNKKPEAIAAKGENRPKIVISREQRVFVSWTQKTKARYSGHIRFSYSSNGKEFSKPVTINDHLAETSHRFDSLGISERGEIFVTWLDKRDRMEAEAAGQTYVGAALYYAVSHDGGK